MKGERHSSRDLRCPNCPGTLVVVVDHAARTRKWICPCGYMRWASYVKRGV